MTIMKTKPVFVVLAVVAVLQFVDICQGQSGETVKRYKLVEETVYDREPVKLRKRIVETVYDVETVYEWKPVYETETTEKRTTVQRPVQKSKSYTEKYTVREPVVETSMEEREIRETRMETVTEMQEQDFLVEKKTYETEMREETTVVNKPVVETEMRRQVVRRYRPTTVEKDVLVPSNLTVNQLLPTVSGPRLQWLQRGYYTDPVTGQSVYRRPGLHWVGPTSGALVQSRNIPVLSNQKMTTTELVPEDVEIETPITVRRVVQETQTRKIPVQN